MEDASKSIAFEPTPTAGDAAPDTAPTLSTTGPDQGGKGGEGGDRPQMDAATAEPAAIETVEGGEAGKEGDSATPFTPSTALQMSNSAFLAAIFTAVPEGAQPVITSLKGDPESKGGWPPFSADEVDAICTADQNNYFNCSSFRADTDGKLAARKELAAAYHFLILDDVGTKVDSALIAPVTPTSRIETSPGNFQVGYKLDPPLTNPKEVAAFQKKIAAAGLTDKGALGIGRWGRLPSGINGKPKYKKDGKPFVTVLHEWNPQVAYSAEELLGLLVPHTEEAEVKTRPATKAKRKPDRDADDDRVYFPRTVEHPVVTEFKRRGLYKREISTGKHDVTCPWCSEHTDAIDTGAAYFEPDAEHPSGGFCCQHSHKDQYHIRQLLDEFGLSTTQVRNRPLIRTVAGEMKAIVDAAEDILAQRGDLYQAGGLIVTAGRDDVTGDVNMKPLSESALTLALASGCDWEKYDKRSHGWERCDPPIRHVGMIYKAQGYGRLPTLNGLARQPYYREQDGQLVRTPGYDAVSKRLGIFDPKKFPPIKSTPEAARAALAELEELIGEFHFYQPTDKAAALAAIFTAVTRPSLGLAPAFHVSAPASGSGKSFLCETISLFAGPGTPARMSYPKTSDEATKAILSILLTGPAVIEFDDMDTDWLPHGVINRMLTSRSITDRVLGVSKVATVRTDALVLGSGNNVGPIRDLSRRVLTINLNARSETPGTLVYNGNPVCTLKVERERYVMLVLTIIEAWKAAGSPRSSVPSIASYGGTWADYCRHPLIWLGLPDPATTLLEQMLSDPDADNLQRLLSEWHRRLGSRPYQLRQLLAEAHGKDLEDALLDLPVVDKGVINRSRLGRYFKRNQNRIVGGYMLERVENSERTAWRVVQAGAETPPLPPLPPSSEPGAEIVGSEDEF